MERVERLPRQAASVSLIRHRRVGEAIADDPIAALERRPDRLHQVIAPCGYHEERFGLGIPALRLALHQQPADFLGTRRAAGLTSADRGLPCLLQRLDQELGVGRFACALAAFERDEPAAAQRLPQTRYPAATAIRSIGPSFATD